MPQLNTQVQPAALGLQHGQNKLKTNQKKAEENSTCLPNTQISVLLILTPLNGALGICESLTIFWGSGVGFFFFFLN